MKKLLVAVLTTAAVLQAGSAFAAASYKGSIQAGQPANVINEAGVGGAGLAQTLGACDVNSQFNGTDGHWYASSGTSVTLTMAATLDGGVLFYNSACTFIAAVDKEFIGGTELGKVPASAAFALVTGYAGTGTYTLSFS